MSDRWSLFKTLWRTEDADELTTDASAAKDSLVETAVNEGQAAFKKITDMTVSLSAEHVDLLDTLRKVKDSATLAYSYALSGETDNVIRELRVLMSITE